MLFAELPVMEKPPLLLGGTLSVRLHFFKKAFQLSRRFHRKTSLSPFLKGLLPPFYIRI
jgi:hypothetical protein